MVFRQLRQKRPGKPPKKAEVQFVYQCLNEGYRCGSRLALLVLLMNICTAVALNAHADSNTHWQQGAVSLTGDPSCNVSILPISNMGTMARGGDMKATCVRYAYPSALGPGAAPSANVKASPDAGPQIVGYVLPVTIASRTGPLASLSVTNPSDRIIHLKADVKEWHQDAFGQDVFVASSTAFISPTRVLIEPGATRQLSVKLPESSEQELAFRIVLQQLPEETHTNTAGTFSRIAQSLPAFSEPAQPERSKLRARRIGAQYLLITNEGGRRARLMTISSNGQIVAAQLVSYALAHSNVLVRLNLPLNGSAIDIETDQGHHVVEVR
jgi:P pilus assembly chaperone PapD